ncbi:MAG: hypothetical protein K2Y14_11275 [Burkholderiales bacterium]|nr:hypothetical protein [Burkholderiales bacterium]
MAISVSISVPMAGTIVVTAGGAIYYSGVAGFLDLRLSFLLLTLLLLVYLGCELFRLYSADSRRFFINPAFLCSVMTLGLFYGITNSLYYLPDSINIASVGVKPLFVTESMVKLEFMAIIAAAGMWIGYWSKTSQKIIDSNYAQRMIKNYFTNDAELKDGAIVFLVGVGLLSRLVQLYIGIYGYSGSYVNFIGAAAYSQYFMLGGYLGKIALIVIALQYYAKTPSLKTRSWFYFILFIELFFGGFLTGFKKLVLAPFIIILLSQYSRTGRASIIWFLFIVISINVAYPVIERFRAIRNSMETNFPSTSLIDITQIMFFPTEEQISKASYDEQEDDAPVYLRVMARTSMVGIGSLGVDFYDQHDSMPEGSPEVLTEVFLSPLYSWIPRFIWSGKTLQNIGLWYTQVVMGLKYSFSSTAMGMITYLYIGGGYLVVLFGFIFIGIMQRIAFGITQPWKTCAGSLVAMSTVVMISSIAELNMDALIVLLVRMMPIVIFLQSIIYKHNRVIISDDEIKHGVANDE